MLLFFQRGGALRSCDFSCLIQLPPDDQSCDLRYWRELMLDFSEVAGAPDADRLIAPKSLIQEMDDKVNSIENQTDGWLLMAALSHLWIYDSLRCRKTNVSLLKRKKKEDGDPLWGRCFPAAVQQGASSTFTQIQAAAERGPLSWPGMAFLCTCARACVSLMAAFQLVRPNELIANGNGGLKCNWISGFCPLKGGRLAGKTTPPRPPQHYL